MAKCAGVAVMEVISSRGRRHLAGHGIQMKPEIVPFEKREKGREREHVVNYRLKHHPYIKIEVFFLGGGAEYIFWPFYLFHVCMSMKWAIF